MYHAFVGNRTQEYSKFHTPREFNHRERQLTVLQGHDDDKVVLLNTLCHDSGNVFHEDLNFEKDASVHPSREFCLRKSGLSETALY